MCLLSYYEYPFKVIEYSANYAWDASVKTSITMRMPWSSNHSHVSIVLLYKSFYGIISFLPNKHNYYKYSYNFTYACCLTIQILSDNSAYSAWHPSIKTIITVRMSLVITS